MREMLSRGKRIDSNEWVYWNRYGRLTDINGEPTKIEINTSILRPYAFYINELPVIKAHTVGDYTGLTDENGKRIFEGDIVELTYYTLPKDRKVKAEVAYEEEIAAFVLYPLGAENEGISLEIYNIEKVIGNIYDNFELLQEGKQ